MGCGPSTPLSDYLKDHPGNYGKQENLERAYITLCEYLDKFESGPISSIKKIEYIEKSRSIEIGEAPEWKFLIVIKKGEINTFSIWLNSDPKISDVKRLSLPKV